METTILYLYLKRVAEGDTSYRERLCRKIADWIVYLPVREDPETLGCSPIVRVNIPCSNKAPGGAYVPVFTSPEHFTRWSQAQGERHSSIPVVCAELCRALNGDVQGVHINPESDLSVELGVRDKKQIAALVEQL